VAHPDANWSQLDSYLAHWEGGVIVKRLGYLLETMALPIPDREKRLERWQEMLSQDVSPLEPGADVSGPTVMRWRVRVNVDVDQRRR
jgi:predicted transcriptional regulator of viral defense system